MKGPRYRPRPGVGGGAAASEGLAVLLVVVAICLGPVTVGTVFVTVALLAATDQRHWQEVAWISALATVLMLIIFGASGSNLLVHHYGALVDWVSTGLLSFSGIGELIAGDMPLGVPLGVLLGCGVFGTAEVRSVGADWHPLDQRWHRVEAVRERRRLTQAAGDRSAQATCSSPPLGVFRDGDYLEVQDGSYAVMAEVLKRSIGLAIIGAPGSGKTETLKRLVTCLADAGISPKVLDFKATDPAFVEEVIAAYLLGAGTDDARVHLFPNEAIDGWRGSREQIVSRLMAVEDFTEPFYKSVTRTILELVVGEGCSSSAEFLDRFTLAALVKLAALGDAHMRSDVDALKTHRQAFQGAQLRYGGFFRALRGRFDGKTSYGDVDVFVGAIRALAASEDAKATMKILANDIKQWAIDPMRRPRGSQPFALVIDEFSSMAGVVGEEIIDMVEKLRDVGGIVIVTAQSYEGLGADEDQRERLLGALGGGVILHRTTNPERFCELAGTERDVEQSFQLQDTGHSGLGSLRSGFRMKVKPDDVRSAETGEAWYIAQGRYAHLQVLQAEVDGTLVAARRLVADKNRRAEESDTPSQPLPTAIEAPKFLGGLDNGT